MNHAGGVFETILSVIKGYQLRYRKYDQWVVSVWFWNFTKYLGTKMVYYFAVVENVPHQMDQMSEDDESTIINEIEL